ncbi:hypothetical protein [Mesorhizobium sp. BHbdii]
MRSDNDAMIDAMVERARAIVTSEGATRASLSKVLDALKKLAALPDQWNAANYADPEPNERQARYLVRSDDDQGFTLYLNVMRPGNKVPPHNHTTWACIAAVEGSEHNTLYDRIDGGTGPGPAKLTVTGEVEVRPGEGIALLANEIHSVEIRSETPIRHLHFYGKALEALTERLVFDLEAETAQPMKMAVATKR